MRSDTTSVSFVLGLICDGSVEAVFTGRVASEPSRGVQRWAFAIVVGGTYASILLAPSLFGAVMGIQHHIFHGASDFIVRNPIGPELEARQNPHLMVKSLVSPVSYLTGARRGAAPWGRAC